MNLNICVSNRDAKFSLVRCYNLYVSAELYICQLLKHCKFSLRCRPQQKRVSQIFKFSSHRCRLSFHLESRSQAITTKGSNSHQSQNILPGVYTVGYIKLVFSLAILSQSTKCSVLRKQYLKHLNFCLNILYFEKQYKLYGLNLGTDH